MASDLNRIQCILNLLIKLYIPACNRNALYLKIMQCRQDSYRIIASGVRVNNDFALVCHM
ncbi:hypothetical protein D3C71_1872300 [compost metagenome]